MRMFHRIVESPQPPQDIDAIWLCGEDFHHFHHGRWEPMPAPKDGNVWMAIKELRCAICRLKKEVEGGGVKHILVNGVECEISDDGSVSLSIPTKTSDLNNDSGFTTIADVTRALSGYQPLLESGTNIKTINGNSILGSGNIDIQGGGGSYTAGDNISISPDNKISVTGITELIATKQNQLINQFNIKSINNQSLLGSGNINISGGSTSVGFKSTAFKRSNTAITATPQGGTFDNPIPDGGWSDGVPSGTAQLWMTTRWFYEDTTIETAWTTPMPVSDTSTIDIEFSAVDPNPGTPTTNPDNWHDASEATSSDVYMAVRTIKNGVYGDWAITKIKGEKGEDGRDGTDGVDGTSVKIVGTKSSESELPIPYTGDVGDGYMIDGYLYVWDGDSWENVGKIQGPAGMSYKVFIAYSDYSTGSPLKPIGETGRYIGQYVGDASEAQSQDPSRYTWTKFKGEDGWGYEYIFQRTASDVAPAIPASEDSDEYVPTYWSDDPIDVTEEYPYCWMVFRIKKDGHWGEFKGNNGYAVLFAKYGVDGTDGADGTDGEDAEVWKIICTPSAVEKKNNTWSPNAIQVNVLHTRGIATETLLVEQLAPLGLHLYYSYYDNNTWSADTEYTGVGPTFPLIFNIPTTATGLIFKLKDIRGSQPVIVDEVSFSFYSFGTTGYSVACPYRGEYKSTTTYYGNEHRRDIVEHQGHYYIAAVIEGSEGFIDQEPTESSIYWEPFGEEFSSVATDILFANLSYIKNLGVNYLSVFEEPIEGEEPTVIGGMKPHDSSGQALLWLGGTPDNANFYVEEDGTLHAKDGFFSGTIESADGVFGGFLETEFIDIDDDFSGGVYYITPGTQETPGTLNVRVRPASNRNTIYLPPATSGNVGKACNLWIDPTNFSSGYQGEPTMKVQVSASGINQQVLYLKNFTDGTGISSRFETTYGFETKGGYIQFTCVSHKVSTGTAYYWYVTNMKLHEPSALSHN